MHVPRPASTGAGLAAAIPGSAAVTVMMGCPVPARFAGYAKPARFLAVRGLCLLATGRRRVAVLLVARLAVQPEMPEAPAAAGCLAGRHAEAGHPPGLYPAVPAGVRRGSAPGDRRTAVQTQRARP